MRSVKVIVYKHENSGSYSKTTREHARQRNGLQAGKTGVKFESLARKSKDSTGYGKPDHTREVEGSSPPSPNVTNPPVDPEDSFVLRFVQINVPNPAGMDLVAGAASQSRTNGPDLIGHRAEINVFGRIIRYALRRRIHCVRGNAALT